MVAVKPLAFVMTCFGLHTVSPSAFRSSDGCSGLGQSFLLTQRKAIEK